MADWWWDGCLGKQWLVSIASAKNSGFAQGDPLGGRFSSRRLSVLLPLIVSPLNHSPTDKCAHFNAHRSVHENVRRNDHGGYCFMCQMLHRSPRRLPRECSRLIFIMFTKCTWQRAWSLFTCSVCTCAVSCRLLEWYMHRAWLRLQCTMVVSRDLCHRSACRHRANYQQVECSASQWPSKVLVPIKLFRNFCVQGAIHQTSCSASQGGLDGVAVLRKKGEIQCLAERVCNTSKLKQGCRPLPLKHSMSAPLVEWICIHSVILEETPLLFAKEKYWQTHVHSLAHSLASASA